jgi:succinate dehydrogenase / fumarate reductase, cytochrome b subunit
MTAALTLYRSSIGKKAVMAITGLIGIGYLILHMTGNLKIFQGPEHFNEYAEFLRTIGSPVIPERGLLWVIRLVLLAAVALHVTAAYQLTRMDWAGRPVRYAQLRPVQQSFASRTMRWGGVILLLFVIYHLLHFTIGAVHPSFVQGDAYRNVVSGFQIWWVTIFYIAAMLALGLHLYHGFWSMFQTLGLNNVTYTRLLRGLSILVALGISVGFVAVPIAVLFGVLA